MIRLLLLLPLVLALSAQPAYSNEQPAIGDWQTQAKNAGLNEAEIKRLGADKVLGGRTELLQSFSAYLGSAFPQFLTSDAVLNAYHVLFEETLRLQELANAPAYQKFLPMLWKLLAVEPRPFTGDEEYVAAAQTRAQFIIGVAVKLLGGDISLAPDPLRVAIEEEAAAIEKAEGQRKPALLGPPDPDFLGFDYTLFRPAGFYENSPKLQRYFRVVRWLQLVPFRTKRPEELLSFLIMDAVLQMENPDDSSREERDSLRSGFEHATSVWARFGLKSEGCPFEFNSRGPFTQQEATKEFLLKETSQYSTISRNLIKLNSVPTNDRLREPPADPDAEPEFRLLQPLDLPEAQALRAAEAIPSAAGSPAGLEFAAWLGTPLARRLLEKRGDAERLAALDHNLPENPNVEDSDGSEKPIPAGWENVDDRDGTCWAQMHALRGLFEMDPRAPNFLQSESWQRKTLLTICASWAQHRHAWILQSRTNILYGAAFHVPQQLIEPVPEFFQRLGLVCAKMSRLSSEIEEYSEFSEAIQSDLESLIEGIQSKKPPKEFIKAACHSVERYQMVFSGSVQEYSHDQAGLENCLPFLESLVKLIASQDPATLKTLNDTRDAFELWGFTPGKVRQQWEELSRTCLRVALLCHKQLSQTAFSASETSWLQSIGSQLAEAMLYQGNSYLSPNDDAPRIARLSSNPRDGSVLHVAIGRPRKLHVLYPWKDGEIYCEGAVMPYHEMTDTRTITDEEWRKRFQGGERPPVPAWLREMVPTEGIGLNKK